MKIMLFFSFQFILYRVSKAKDKLKKNIFDVMVSSTNLHDKSLLLLVLLYRTKRHVFKPDRPVNFYPYFEPRTVSVGPLHLSVR